MDNAATSHNTRNNPAKALLSVVVPTLNEADNIAATLMNLENRCYEAQLCEIVLVDGGSNDSTLDVVQACIPRLEKRGLNMRIFRSKRGRAHQMNLGAEKAGGDILLFLHADTLLPPYFDTSIRNTLNAEHLTLGAFRLNTDKNTRSMQWICGCANLRTRLLALPYGDQALFIRRADFIRLHMFPALEIMEDFAFVRKVKRNRGKISLLTDAVVTSARRWRKRGYIFTSLCNQMMIMGYYLRIPTRILARWYRG
ncbi:MAG: TIGR04283 family arsenosugar biosynthesis glycosyltransferase [Desulfuromonadaceae bacterium]